MGLEDKSKPFKERWDELEKTISEFSPLELSDYYKSVDGRTQMMIHFYVNEKRPYKFKREFISQVFHGGKLEEYERSSRED